MFFDLNSLVFFFIAFVGGLIAVPVGGSFLFVIPAFLLLGLDGLQTLLLGRIFMIAATGSSSAYFFTQQKFSWKQVFYFLSGNVIGLIIAAKVATSIEIDTLTAVVPWVLLGGAVLLLKEFKITNPKLQKIFFRLIPLIGCLLGFYAGLGGGGNGKIIVLLFTLALGWNFHKSIINTRLVEFFGNTIVVAAYLYFGSELTGFEIPVILGAILGGFLGAKITLKSKPKWLQKAFFVLVIISIIKTTLF